MYEDKTLICKDCEQEFTFTAGEQAFYEEKSYTEPKRCPECRKIKKQKQIEFNDRSRLYR